MARIAFEPRLCRSCSPLIKALLTTPRTSQNMTNTVCQRYGRVANSAVIGGELDQNQLR